MNMSQTLASGDTDKSRASAVQLPNEVAQEGNETGKAVQQFWAHSEMSRK
jgi:hypothetical protein